MSMTRATNAANPTTAPTAASAMGTVLSVCGGGGGGVVVAGAVPSRTTARDWMVMGSPDVCATAARFTEAIWAGSTGARMSSATVRSANSLRRWMPRTSTASGGRRRADAKALLSARSMEGVKAEAGRSEESLRDRRVGFDGGGVV
jgi:hypothetical protein